MNARVPACVVLAAALAGSGATLAADPPPGRAKAQACATCHGASGVSVTPDAPNLAGQPAIYVAAQLKAFRDGTRKHEVMNVMARPLTDADIDALAGWYASIRIEAQPPR